ncbi:MAG: VWA domain-containing protein [Anaerolineaceae bacterium]
MKRCFYVIFLLIFLILIPIFPFLATNAQSTWDIRINTINTVETPDHMILKVYFNIFDPSTGAAVTDATLSNAQITLLNTNLVANGELKEPDVPIYVALVLDTSGSMAGSEEILKNAAKLAVSNTPNNSFFSIVQFNEEIKLLQDFTENIAALSFAIDQMKVSQRGTCLYDAAYTAVEAMEKAPAGRRAVILFTDGKDETREGKVCSKHSYQELVDKAMKDQVPIHTIGLSAKEANINTLELQSMAASTGAFSAIGKQSDLEKAFAEIMNALKAQWMVESNLYPRNGENNAVLALNVSENETINTAFVINSNTDYPGPPSPVSAQLDGLFFLPQNQTYDLQLSLTSPDLVQYVKVSLWDEKGGSKTAEFVFKDPAEHNTFNFPSDQLTMGREYEIRIIAVSKADNTPFAILSEDNKPITEMVHTFTFDPSAVLPQVKVQSVVQQGNDLQVNIETTNSSLVNGFDGWLVDESTKTVVQNSNFSQASFSANSGSILLPLEANKIADGTYTVVVRALGNQNQVYATQQYEGIVYKATRQTVIQKIIKALIASPLYLFIIIGIILVVVAFFMVNSMREKSLSGTPVMQGRLGRKIKGSKKQSGQNPLASDEPILNRNAGNGGFQQQPRVVPPQTPVRPTPQPVPTPAQPEVMPMNMQESTIVGIPGINNNATVVGTNKPIMPVLVFDLPIGSTGNRVSINQFPFTIGRQDTTLVLSDASVSRKHAQITIDPYSGGFAFTDLNSSNGSLVNGSRVAPGQPVSITSGTRIRVGNIIEFTFETR